MKTDLNTYYLIPLCLVFDRKLGVKCRIYWFGLIFDTNQMLILYA